MCDGKKAREKLQVRAAANIMNKIWELTDSEEPDFLVKSDAESFGLEVTQCFHGKTSKKRGSVALQNAMYRNKKMKEIRSRCIDDFPYIVGWLLCYAGDWKDEFEVERRIRYAINSMQPDRGPTALIPVSEVSDPTESGARMPDFVSINKGPYREAENLWSYMSDTVGPIQIESVQIQDSINCKEKRLPTYREKSDNIRLLIYCSSLSAAENVSVDDQFTPDLKGFDYLYFVHFPNYVAEFFYDMDGKVKRIIHDCSGRNPENLR